MSNRRILVALAAAVLVLVPAAPASALLGFTAPVKLATGGSPTMATDGAGHTYVAYGFSGVHLKTNKTGSWVDRTVTTNTATKFDGSPYLALDKQAHAFIAFLRFDSKVGHSIGVWLATNRTGSWVITRLTQGNDYSPSVAVDGNGKVHVAYYRMGTGQGVHYHTNASGSWADTLVAGNGAPSQPTLALVSGTPTIVYNRTATVSAAAPCGVYLWRKATGQEWVSGTWLTDHYYNSFDDCWGFESRPQVGNAGDGTHVMFSYAGNPSPGMYNTYKDQGKWGSANYGPQGFGLIVGAAFSASRIDTVTAQFNNCSLAPNCGNGLYYAKLTRTGGWQGFTQQLTTRSDTCNQRSGSNPNGPYTCDDQPQINLYNGSARVVFARAGNTVQFMHH